MPTRYKTLGNYIRTRAADLGLNTHSLIDALNERYKPRKITFGASYINSIVNEQFVPSQKRCHLIAEFFGDDPNIILQLAGYYSPPKDTELVEAVAGVASQLPPAIQHMIVSFSEFIQSYFGPACYGCNGANEDSACLLLPNGKILLVKVPPGMTTKMIQQTLDSAFSNRANEE